MPKATGPIIWVVEDDPSVQRMISENLKLHNFRPEVFISAEKAYSALTFQEPPSLIILDILLPGMSGVDLIRLLKQNKIWEKIPVVVVSVLTRHDSPAKESANEISSAYWVNKPFETEHLIHTIQDILIAVR
jgi:two-component system alkaline phosphatase synthesis response regulator PhoP